MRSATEEAKPDFSEQAENIIKLIQTKNSSVEDIIDKLKSNDGDLDQDLSKEGSASVYAAAFKREDIVLQLLKEGDFKQDNKNLKKAIHWAIIINTKQ